MQARGPPLAAFPLCRTFAWGPGSPGHHPPTHPSCKGACLGTVRCFASRPTPPRPRSQVPTGGRVPGPAGLPTWRAGVRVPSTSNRQRTRSFLRAPSAVTAMAAARGAGKGVPRLGGVACYSHARRWWVGVASGSAYRVRRRRRGVARVWTRKDARGVRAGKTRMSDADWTKRRRGGRGQSGWLPLGSVSSKPEGGVRGQVGGASVDDSCQMQGWAREEPPRLSPPACLPSL